MTNRSAIYLRTQYSLSPYRLFTYEQERLIAVYLTLLVLTNLT